MNVVRIIEITDEKEGKRKKTNDDGSVSYVPWHYRKFKGETSINGEPKTIWAKTFEHIEKDKLYEGELKSEDYQGKKKWKFENVKEFTDEGGVKEWREPDTSGAKPTEKTKPAPETPTALPATDTRIAALKCSLIFYGKEEKLSTKKVLDAAREFEEYFKNG